MTGRCTLEDDRCFVWVTEFKRAKKVGVHTHCVLEGFAPGIICVNRKLSTPLVREFNRVADLNDVFTKLMNMLEFPEHGFESVRFSRSGGTGYEDHSVAMVKRALKCSLLACFNSNLIEVSKDWSIDTNDDGSSVVTTGAVKAERHPFSGAGVCSNCDIDFCSLASLHKFITINASHIAEGVG